MGHPVYIPAIQLPNYFIYGRRNLNVIKLSHTPKIFFSFSFLSFSTI